MTGFDWVSEGISRRNGHELCFMDAFWGLDRGLLRFNGPFDDAKKALTCSKTNRGRVNGGGEGQGGLRNEKK